MLNDKSLDLDLKRSMKINISVLKIFGIWPPEEKEWTWKTTTYTVWAIFAVGFFFFVYLFSEIINMIMVWGDLEKMTEACFLLLTHVAQVIKFTRFSLRPRSVQNLTNRLNLNIFQIKHIRQKKIVIETINTIRLYTIFFLLCAVATVTLWAIFPLLDPVEKKKLPLSAWFPFDTKRSPVYEIIYIYQIVVVMIDAATNICIDTIITAIMTHACCQLRILKDSLMHIREDALQEYKNLNEYKKNTQLYHQDQSFNFPPMKGESINKTNKEKYDESTLNKLVLRNFKNCVQHHKEIIKYIHETESLFHVSLFSQFIVSCVIICITAFQLTLVSPKSLQFPSMILYQSCMLIEILLHCWYGNEIIILSSSLADSIYHTEWYSCDMKFKKCMLYYMLCTKRPLQVRAGKFFSLSIGTFTSILRSSYSYFAVLQRVHNN